MLRKQNTFSQEADVSLEDLESPEAKTWIQKQVQNECARIKASGATALPLTMKNCGILVEHDDIASSSAATKSSTRKRRVKVINRIEIASGMDFTSIAQLMVSEPIDYPFKQDYKYIHVLAFTARSNSMALLVPYLYAPYLKQARISTDAATRGEAGSEEVVAATRTDKEGFENTLREWLLINEKHGRARHSIKEYHAIA